MTTPESVHICPPDHQHGLKNTCRTNHHCKCEDCRRANRERMREVRRAKAYGLHAPSLVPARGTQRRLQALVQRGWSQKKLADQLNLSPQRLSQVLDCTYVRASTVERVDRLFRDLWQREPPHENRYDLIAFNRAKRHARQQGWPGPLDWDDIDNDDAPASVPRAREGVDDAAVELAITGSRIHLNPDERLAAVRALHGEGLTDPQIAHRINCSDRTVLRIRDKLHLPSNDDVYNPSTTTAHAA